MIIHIVNPKRVRLITALDAERTRECLFEVNAEVNEFRFGHWYDQEAFMIELQANFQSSEDLEIGPEDGRECGTKERSELCR